MMKTFKVPDIKENIIWIDNLALKNGGLSLTTCSLAIRDAYLHRQKKMQLLKFWSCISPFMLHETHADNLIIPSFHARFRLAFQSFCGGTQASVHHFKLLVSVLFVSYRLVPFFSQRKGIARPLVFYLLRSESNLYTFMHHRVFIHLSHVFFKLAF